MTDELSLVPIGSVHPDYPDLIKVGHAYHERKEIRAVGGMSIMFADGGNMLLARGENGMLTPAATAYRKALRAQFDAGDRWITVRHGDSYQSASAIVEDFRRQFELPMPPPPLWDRLKLLVGAARPHNPYPHYNPPPRGIQKLLRWLGQKELPERKPQLLPGGAEKTAEFETKLRAGLIRELPVRPGRARLLPRS
jgi:hypothetical protein